MKWKCFSHLFRVVVATTVASTAGLVYSATISLNSVADTYSRAGVNAGAAAVMDIRDFATPDFIGYFRFDLTSVPKEITGATLTLHKVASAQTIQL